MSDSKPPSSIKYDVHFHLPGSDFTLENGLCTTEIFGPSGAMVAEQQGNFSLQLPKGIYRARVRGFGQVKDSLFLVEETGSSRVELDMPQRYSSAPISNSGCSPVYYSESFLQRSITREPINSGESTISYLFIFIRMMGKATAAGKPGEDTPAHLFAGLSLLDNHGQLLCRFDANEVVQDSAHGIARFRVAIAPGYYRLVYTAADNISEWMPIHVLAKNWDTDISLIWRRGRPHLSTMSLFTPVSNGAPQLDTYYYKKQVTDIDAVIQTLSSGARSGSVGSSLVRSLLNDKFSNPMLGILGLHMVLLGSEANRSNVEEIIQNLRMLAPDSPDVEALRYIAWEKNLCDAPDAWQFRDIPMVKLGAQAMHRALISTPAEDGAFTPNHAEQLFLYFQPSSPWSQTKFARQPSLLKAAVRVGPLKAFGLLEREEKLRSSPLVQKLVGSLSIEGFGHALFNLAIKKIMKKDHPESLSVPFLLENHAAETPIWLVEVLVQELPNLKRAYEEGRLRDELTIISSRYEILPSTIYQIVIKLLTSDRNIGLRGE